MPISATCTRGRLGDEPAVAFVRHEDDGARVADTEVRTGDADIGGVERLAKLASRRPRQLLQLCRHRFSVDAREKRSDVLLRLLDRRSDDVDGVLTGELEDVFAEIGFDDADAHGLEGGVEPDLLRRHRLRLGRELRAVPCADVCDVRVRVRGRSRDHRLAAVPLDSGAEPLDMRVEIVDHTHARVVRTVAERLYVRKTAPGLLPVTQQARGRRVERSRHMRVCELQPGDLAERARARA